MKVFKYKNHVGTTIILLSFVFAPFCHADRPDLTIVQGQTKRVLTNKDLKKLTSATINIEDPVYHEHKRYNGYWLTDIFQLAGLNPDPNTVWTFTALDGYKARIAVADVFKAHAQALVAIRDLDAPGNSDWENLQQGKEWIKPGPYYLVWQVPPASHAKLPWPYQIVEISVRDIDEAQEKLFPSHARASEPVVRGYKIFQQNCIACHSLNLEGGVLGPELNVPRNILEYENRVFIRKFINNPSSFRARSKMPAFNKTLSDKDINDLLDYLAWMGRHKVRTPTN